MLSDTGPFNEIGEAGEASPHYRGSWRRVGGSVEIPSEPRYGGDVEVQISRFVAHALWHRSLEQPAFDIALTMTAIMPI